MPSSKSVPPPTAKRYEFQAIGTHWKIDMRGTIPLLQNIEPKIMARIELFDNVYSRFRADSLVTKMSQTAGEYVLPDDAQVLLEFYYELYCVTKGGVTPLIGQALVDAGYDADYRLTPRDIAAVPSWEEAMIYSFPRLTVAQPVLLDFGAAGKGYLVDLVAGLIQECGITDYTVNAGGDIYHYSKLAKTIRIGLEHPENADQVIGVIELHNESICGSAGNRRAWDKYTHHISPFTLSSPTLVRATWVTAKSALVADGLSTSLFFVEPEVLESNYTFEYLMVYEDYSFKKSKNFTGDLFIAGRTPS